MRIDDPGPLYIRLSYDESLNILRINNWDPTPHGGPGPVEITNTVQIGDALISINSVSLVGADFRTSILAIKTASKPRTLTFYRITAHGNACVPQPPKISEVTDASREPLIYMLQSLLGMHQRQIYNSTTINEDDLRRIASGGLQNEASRVRGVVWRLLLHFLPLNCDTWHEQVSAQRALYREFLCEFTGSECMPSNFGK